MGNQGRLQRIFSKAPLVVLIAIAVVRAPTFVYPILDEDEAIHATIGATIASGLKPYIHAVDGKLPLLWYEYAAVFHFFGPYNMFAVHALTLIIVCVTAYLLYRTATLLTNERAGFCAALLYGLYSTASFYKILASNFELHFLVFECLAIFWVVHARGRRRGWIFWGLAGVAAAFATLTKQQAGIILVSLPAASFIGWDRNIRTALLGLAAMFAGFMAVLCAFALFAKAQGYYDDMILWTLRFPMNYIQGGNEMIASPGRAAWRIGWWILSTLPLWIGAASALRQRSRTALFALTLLLFSFIPISLGGRFFAHYFLMNLPGLCLLAASSFEHLFANDFPRARRAILLALTLFPPLLFLGVSLAMPVVKRWEGLIVPDFERLGARVAMLTTRDERIFVWGWAPEIYVFSGRLPAARFVFTDVLSGRIPGSAKEEAITQSYQERLSPAAWEMLWQDFEKLPPRLIVDSAAADIHEYAPYPLKNYALQDFIDTFYERVPGEEVPMYLLQEVISP